MKFGKHKSILIAGCGSFGAAMAKSLYNKGYRVIVVDRDKESFKYLSEEYGGYEMEGDPTDPEVLQRAGIGQVQMLIAASQSDNANLLTAQIASSIFHVERVYVRLNDAGRKHLLEDLPIKPIYPYSLSAEEYQKLAEYLCQEVAV